jgi:hypothetical protein
LLVTIGFEYPPDCGNTQKWKIYFSSGEHYFYSNLDPAAVKPKFVITSKYFISLITLVLTIQFEIFFLRLHYKCVTHYSTGALMYVQYVVPKDHIYSRFQSALNAGATFQLDFINRFAHIYTG